MKAPLLLAVAAGLLGCHRTGDPVPTQRFDLVYQQPATVTGIQFTLNKVYDSRCPVGAQCIWGGYAAVTVALQEDNDKQTANISLNFKADANYQPDSALVTLNQHSYWLRLLAVNPYPALNSPPQPITATLRLRPR